MEAIKFIAYKKRYVVGGLKQIKKKVPVPILEFRTSTWFELAMSIPSVLGAASGALIVMLLMFAPSHFVKMIWAFWGLICVNP